MERHFLIRHSEWRSTRRKLLGPTLAAGMFWCACQSVVAADEQTPVAVDEAGNREIASSFLADPGVVPGLALGAEWPRSMVAGGKTYDVVVRSEPERRQGVLTVSPQLRRVVGYTQYAPGYLPARCMAGTELKEVAEGFGGRHVPGHLQLGTLTGPPAGGVRPDICGSVAFTWRQVADGVLLPMSARIHVRVWDGRIKSYCLEQEALSVAITPRLGAADAEAVARRHLAHLDLDPGGLLHASCSVDCNGVNGKQQLRYGMVFVNARGPASRYAAAMVGVSLDAITGDVLEVNQFIMSSDTIEWVRRGYDLANLGSNPPVQDDRPCWAASEAGDGRIVFASTRARPGRPYWAGRPKTVFEVDPLAGSLACVAQALESSFDLSDAGLDVVAMSTDGDVEFVLLDLRTGQLKDATTERRPGCDLTVSTDGRRLAYASDRGGSDNDIFVADRSDPAGTERRVIKMAGEDRYPRLSPDGSVVYFVHEHYQRGQRRPSYELWVANARWPYQENDPPRRVLAGLPMIERMTISADGRRLLLWHPPGMSVVDPTTGGREELVWPELHDPDYPDTPPLGVAEPAISGDGHWVAFQGRRLLYPMETNPASYLYVCDLRGANLRRLTPLANDTVPPLRFPATGKLAFEIGDDLPEMQAAMR